MALHDRQLCHAPSLQRPGPGHASAALGKAGQRTVSVSSGGKSGRFPWLGLASNYSAHHSEIGRPLLAPDEIMLLPESCQLLFVQGCRPILAQKLRYFEERAFKGRWTPWRMDNTHDAERADLMYELTK